MGSKVQIAPADGKTLPNSKILTFLGLVTSNFFAFYFKILGLSLLERRISGAYNGVEFTILFLQAAAKKAKEIFFLAGYFL